MKAAVIRGYGGPDELRLEDRPDPIPGPGYVLVRVAATSVNPFDLKMRAGVFKREAFGGIGDVAFESVERYSVVHDVFAAHVPLKRGAAARAGNFAVPMKCAE